MTTCAWCRDLGLDLKSFPLIKELRIAFLPCQHLVRVLHAFMLIFQRLPVFRAHIWIYFTQALTRQDILQRWSQRVHLLTLLAHRYCVDSNHEVLHPEGTADIDAQGHCVWRWHSAMRP